MGCVHCNASWCWRAGAADDADETGYHPYAKALVTAKYNPETHVLDFGTPIIRSDNDVTQRLKKVYVPRFYLDTYQALQACTDVHFHGGAFVVGSPGTGKAVMRNVHAWCIANAMKLDTGAREVKILFATHNGRQEWVRAILVVLTRDTDGRIQAEAVEHDDFMKIKLSQHDYVLAYFTNGYARDAFPALWLKARLWGYSDPVMTLAVRRTLPDHVLYTPNVWPVEELVLAATVLDLTIPPLVHHFKEVSEVGLKDQEARIRNRAELFGGVPGVCLETDPKRAAKYASVFIRSCLNVTDSTIWSERGYNLHQTVVYLVTRWPPERWYSLGTHAPLSHLTLVCPV